MDNVAYLLGAGFSAPLGLPVMSNFLIKSKDLYFEDRKKYTHFVKVFETISELSQIKNYFTSDLFNIEEILSILEMRESLQGSTLSEDFKRYISDVINSYTPDFNPMDDYPGNWQDFIFGRDPDLRLYGSFVASLFGLEYTQGVDKTTDKRTPQFRISPNKEAKYSVITLNYDNVIENVVAYINNNHLHEDEIRIQKIHGRNPEYQGSQSDLRVAKLHGSINEEIVPPTWSKAVNETILSAWKLAFEILSKANKLRIIGYSLPTADAYVKYLLKSGILVSEHLKQIDILCLDDYGTIKARYDSFIDFNYYRYANVDVIDYFRELEKPEQKKGYQRRIKMPYLGIEEQHEVFMNTHAS